MYLNHKPTDRLIDLEAFNYNMGCIWIFGVLCFLKLELGLTITWDVFESWIPYHTRLIHQFNYNMGCIWILLFLLMLGFLIRLTITWDVFELPTRCYLNGNDTFNYNMGCIWIWSWSRSNCYWVAFNYNMGCIWIFVMRFLWRVLFRLTITWDVFE